MSPPWAGVSRPLGPYSILPGTLHRHDGNALPLQVFFLAEDEERQPLQLRMEHAQHLLFVRDSEEIARLVSHKIADGQNPLGGLAENGHTPAPGGGIKDGETRRGQFPHVIGEIVLNLLKNHGFHIITPFRP